MQMDKIPRVERRTIFWTDFPKMPANQFTGKDVLSTEITRLLMFETLDRIWKQCFAQLSRKTIFHAFYLFFFFPTSIKSRQK